MFPNELPVRRLNILSLQRRFLFRFFQSFPCIIIRREYLVLIRNGVSVSQSRWSFRFASGSWLVRPARPRSSSLPRSSLGVLSSSEWICSAILVIASNCCLVGMKLSSAKAPGPSFPALIMCHPYADWTSICVSGSFNHSNTREFNPWSRFNSSASGPPTHWIFCNSLLIRPFVFLLDLALNMAAREGPLRLRV